MKQKLYFINSLIDGEGHEIIDSSFAAHFVINHDLELYTTKSKAQNIIKNCNNLVGAKEAKRIKLREINVPKKTRIGGFFIRDLLASFIDITILLKGDKKAIYFFAFGGSRFLPYYVNFISKKTNRKVIISCHRELEVLNKKKYKFFDNFNFLLNHFYRKIQFSKHLKLVVLGNFILDNLKTELSEERIKQFIAIDHPYFSADKNKINTNYNSKNFIQIGVAGIVYQDKGYDTLMAFANKLSKFKNIKLNIISRIFAKTEELKKYENIVFLNPENIRIEREKYDEYVRKMDYLFYPYDINSYRYSVSGAVFEAIFKSKPIISPRNSHFNYLFQKFGELGYLYDTDEELNDILSEITKIVNSDNPINYRNIIDNLNPLKIKFNFNDDTFL